MVSIKLHYKDDDTFLKYLAMSYVGETAAITLMHAHGHNFEFDGYGAGSVEIFKDAFKKQKRTPDLKCTRCGQKLEVRAKSSLKIAMSDSASRPFDCELSHSDWVGFVRVAPSAPELDKFDPESYVVPSTIYVITVQELSDKKHYAVRSASKSKDKGSESFLIWPSLVSEVTGELLGSKGSPRLVYVKDDKGVTQSLTPPPGSFTYNQIRQGDRVLAGETIICGVARTLSMSALLCTGRLDLR